MKYKSHIQEILAELAQKAEKSSSLPRLIFPEELAARIGLKVGTVRHYTSHKEEFGHLLPTWHKFTGSERLYWYESDVQAWLDASKSTTTIANKRKRGRPTKKEQIQKSVGAI